MDQTLQQFLLNRGYTKVKLHLTKTNHFEMKVALNGIRGSFLLDTGASTSCVGFNGIHYFKLSAEDSELKASGAGPSNMETKISKHNTLKIGKWCASNIALVLFDLTHVNTALSSYNAKAVDGIIGADVLRRSKGVIDYEKKYLYLKI